MTQITAAQVKELRERTGAGMMDCKKFLKEAEGDIEKAIELLRKAGVAKAAKKAHRTAAEGVVVSQLSEDEKSAVIVEFNCETDFVARDKSFVSFAEAVAARALAEKIKDIATLLKTPLVENDRNTIEEARLALVTQLGENLVIRRLRFLETTGGIGSYMHGNLIGVLIALETPNKALAEDLAMHIAASRPAVINPEDVSQEMIEKEKEIFNAQATASGKPPAIIEKMVEGRIKKFLQEISLTGQPFVKDSNKTIHALLKEANNKVEQFVRFEVGEGVEKEESDFVAEVMSQARGEN